MTNSPFDSLINRRGTNSLKWSVAESELPMWVADMDFATAPAITEAVTQKAASGVFGYGVVPSQYAAAIAAWWESRYAWAVEEDSVVFCDGIVPALGSVLRTLTAPGDGVLIQSPVYSEFYAVIEECSRHLVVNNLTYVGGQFSIDWDDLERGLSLPTTKVFILCNPQNPTGQIWSADELNRMGDLAEAAGVILVSDDIHCDITEPGTQYIPFAAIRAHQKSITLISPTKSFNIPGLQAAAAIIPDPDLRTQIAQGFRRDGITMPGSFAVEATIAAYTAGGEWLDDMRAYVWSNRRHLETYLVEHLPALKAIPSQATYLAWIDCSALTDDAGAFAQFLRDQTGLVVNKGEIYGSNATSFIRLNLACPTSVLTDGLTRLHQAVKQWA